MNKVQPVENNMYIYIQMAISLLNCKFQEQKRKIKYYIDFKYLTEYIKYVSSIKDIKMNANQSFWSKRKYKWKTKLPISSNSVHYIERRSSKSIDSSIYSRLFHASTDFCIKLQYFCEWLKELNNFMKHIVSNEMKTRNCKYNIIFYFGLIE